MSTSIWASSTTPRQEFMVGPFLSSFDQAPCLLDGICIHPVKPWLRCNTSPGFQAKRLACRLYTNLACAPCGTPWTTYSMLGHVNCASVKAYDVLFMASCKEHMPLFQIRHLHVRRGPCRWPLRTCTGPIKGAVHQLGSLWQRSRSCRRDDIFLTSRSILRHPGLDPRAGMPVVRAFNHSSCMPPLSHQQTLQGAALEVRFSCGCDAGTPSANGFGHGHWRHTRDLCM